MKNSRFYLPFGFKSGGDLKCWMVLTLNQCNKPVCHHWSFCDAYRKQFFPFLHRFVVRFLFSNLKLQFPAHPSFSKTKLPLHSLFFVNDPHTMKSNFSECECFKWYWESEQSLFKNIKLICWWLLSITSSNYKTITEVDEALANSSI